MTRVRGAGRRRGVLARAPRVERTPLIPAEQVGEMIDVIVRHIQRTDEITSQYRVRAVR